MIKKVITLVVVWAAFSGFATAAETANTSGERQLTLQVNEMNCQLCAYLVNKELRNLDGVVSTKPNIKTQLVKVVVKEPFDNQRLIQAMDGLHYTAAVLPAE